MQCTANTRTMNVDRSALEMLPVRDFCTSTVSDVRRLMRSPVRLASKYLQEQGEGKTPTVQTRLTMQNMGG